MPAADPEDTEQRQQPPEVPVLTASTSASRRVTWSDSHQYHQLPSAVSTSTLDQNPDGNQKVGWWAAFKQQVKALKHEVLALHYAIHDPRTPFLAKLLPLVAIGYALSPLDLIPDFIPVLGLVDDLLILPGLIWLSIHLIPHQVMEECRVKAELEPLLLSQAWGVAVLVACSWTALLVAGEHAAILKWGTGELKDYEWAALAGTAGVCSILFVVWMVLHIKHERRKRDEWNAALLLHQGADPTSV